MRAIHGASMRSPQAVQPVVVKSPSGGGRSDGLGVVRLGRSTRGQRIVTSFREGIRCAGGLRGGESRYGAPDGAEDRAGKYAEPDQQKGQRGEQRGRDGPDGGGGKRGSRSGGGRRRWGRGERPDGGGGQRLRGGDGGRPLGSGIKRNDDSQVIVEPDGAGDGEREDERPGGRGCAGRDDV